MDRFLQVTAAILLSVLVSIVLSKQGKDFAVVLSIAVCSMAVAVLVVYLEPVIAFIGQLQITAGLDPEMVKILLKASGVAVLAEIAALICSDSGNGAMAKMIQLLATAVILYLALPFMQELLNMVQKILEET